MLPKVHLSRAPDLISETKILKARPFFQHGKQIRILYSPPPFGHMSELSILTASLRYKVNRNICDHLSSALHMNLFFLARAKEQGGPKKRLASGRPGAYLASWGIESKNC